MSEVSHTEDPGICQIHRPWYTLHTCGMDIARVSQPHSPEQAYGHVCEVSLRLVVCSKLHSQTVQQQRWNRPLDSISIVIPIGKERMAPVSFWVRFAMIGYRNGQVSCVNVVRRLQIVSRVCGSLDRGRIHIICSGIYIGFQVEEYNPCTVQRVQRQRSAFRACISPDFVRTPASSRIFQLAK